MTNGTNKNSDSFFQSFVSEFLLFLYSICQHTDILHYLLGGYVSIFCLIVSSITLKLQDRLWWNLDGCSTGWGRTYSFLVRIQIWDFFTFYHCKIQWFFYLFVNFPGNNYESWWKKAKFRDCNLWFVATWLNLKGVWGGVCTLLSAYPVLMFVNGHIKKVYLARMSHPNTVIMIFCVPQADLLPVTFGLCLWIYH